ncbi:adult-specific cuticular protein ACP-20-like [Anthonomus grandis grandis]|uniref:adult-specific cuticular protein ACP-20-like n=1 Tax=Anthonomus grandis grandis TaxID=2921223 RepID=UPI0021655EB2|nr:adult-specific cuticular protein ACP-20-like [Anthonomus grandis grandis]
MSLTSSNMNTFTVVFYVSIAITLALAFPDGHDHADHHAPAGYHFEYGVHDPHTKDHKSQEEHRDHDKVKGSYVVHEPDGTKRIVEYTSNKHDGFQAVVRREGHAQHPAHYGKDGHGHAGHGHGGVGGTSYVGVTHWGHGSGK